MNVQPIKQNFINRKQTFGAKPVGDTITNVIVDAMTDIYRRNPQANWLNPSNELNAAKKALVEISKFGENIGLKFCAKKNSATKNIDILMTEDFANRPICVISKEMPALKRILAIRDGLQKSSISDIINSNCSWTKAMKDFTEIFQ